MKILLLILSLTLCATLSAQQGYGSIKGQVCDTSKNIITDAIIILEDTIQHTYMAISDEKGNYIFKNIPFGKYTLTAKVLGFRPIQYVNVPVILDDITIVNFQLKLGKPFITDPDPVYFPVFEEKPGTTTYRRDDIIHMAVPR